MARKYDLIGKNIGKLKVLSLVPVDERPTQNHGNYWLCKCECGNFCEVNSNSLKSGNTSSCISLLFTFSSSTTVLFSFSFTFF